MKQVKKVMDYAACIFPICEKMGKDYGEYFSKKCYTLCTPSTISSPLNRNNTNAISFIGNFGYNRNSQIIELGKALKSLDADGKPTHIDVYSGGRSAGNICRCVGNGLSRGGGTGGDGVMLKRSFLLCCLLVLLCSMGVPVHAENSGACGKNVTWTLDDAGTLTISGEGEMEDHPAAYKTPYPWYSLRDAICSLVIEEGITKIPSSAFYDCDNLVSVQLPDSLTEIATRVFGDCDALVQVDIPDTVTRIGVSAFSGCDALTEVSLPTSLTEISANTFNTCLKLRTIRIPNGVTKIDYGHLLLATSCNRYRSRIAYGLSENRRLEYALP